jgi:hypothetical protein
MTEERKIPAGISNYVKEHFREDFLFDVKEVKEIQGHSYYVIEVSKDDYIHTLKFNEHGTLLQEDAEQAFPPDMHEEQPFGEVPE